MINIKIDLKNKHNSINIDKKLKINVKKLNNFIINYCSIICTINNKDVYLRVTPQNIQWVSINNPIVYNVESNTKWKIK